jgi:regulator of sirC expression with transglutaminase-like and TPR domain
MSFQETIITKPTKIQALVSLLDDPDPDTFQHVRKQLVLLGDDVREILENELFDGGNELKIVHIEAILSEIQLKSTQQKLKIWSQNGASDLLDAFLILTEFKNPGIDTYDIREEIANIQRQIWIELNDNMDPSNQIHTFNNLFFNVVGFHGNEQSRKNPATYFINNVIYNKQGNHLSLGIVYIILARMCGLPVNGINLPGHFIAAYTNQPVLNISHGFDSLDVLYYINPLSRGTTFGRKELKLYLEKSGFTDEEQYYMPVGNRQIIYRLIDEISQVYATESSLKNAEELRQLKSVLF